MPDGVKVPLVGKMPKGALFAGGAAIIAVGGYLIYKHINKPTTTTPTTTTPTAYGYGYGSGTTNSYGYGSQGEYGFGGGGFPQPYGYGPTSPNPFGYSPTPTTNAQWGQDAEAAMGSSGSDAIAAAIAKYLGGSPVTEQQALIIQEAEAVAGPPPQASPTGYPPKIRVQKSGGQGGTTATNPIVGLHQSPGRDTTGVDINWPPSPGATSYTVTSTHGHATMLGKTKARVHDIGRHTTATVQVLANPAASGATPATITVRTK